MGSLDPSHSIEHLRDRLMKSRGLPKQDPHLTRLEASLEKIVASLEHPLDQRLVRVGPKMARAPIKIKER